MFAGPIIAREILTAPRPVRYYLARASYVGLLLILMWTCWQSQVGFTEVSEIGIIAYFGHLLFRFFVLLQLTLMLFSRHYRPRLPWLTRKTDGPSSCC